MILAGCLPTVVVQLIGAMLAISASLSFGYGYALPARSAPPRIHPPVWVLFWVFGTLQIYPTNRNVFLPEIRPQRTRASDAK